MSETDGTAYVHPEPTPYALLLGARLRAVRNRLGLSLVEVEARSHGAYKAVVVGSWERGDRQLTTEKLCQLATFYGADARDLLTGPMPAPPHDRYECALALLADAKEMAL